MLRAYLTSQRGSIPFTALGLIMLLIATVGLYHFNKLDELSVEQRIFRRSDIETFYGSAQMAFQIQQIARMATESVLIKESTESFAEPIDVDKWHDVDKYPEWRDELKSKISNGVEKAVIDSYANYKRHSNELIGVGNHEYDLSNFLEDKGEGSVTVDVKPDGNTEEAKRMLLSISIDPNNTIGIRNKDTSFAFSMRADTLVGVDGRPFTMAEAVYDFTGIFKKESPNIWDFDASKDTVDEFSWYIWAAEEVLGLLEANLKHQVKFATDERVTYSLAHMIIAYKEKQHFGTFDYLHSVREILRPWVGDEEEGKEFLSLLRQSIESGYVDQAIGLMDSGILLGRLNSLSWKVNNGILSVIGKLDSSLINAANFPEDYTLKQSYVSRGVIQRLHTARDISSISKAGNDLNIIQSDVEKAASAPSLFRRSWTSNLWNHRRGINDEYREFVNEIEYSEYLVKTSLQDMRTVQDSLNEMENALDESKCEGILASQLWFGRGGDFGDAGTKGLNEILLVKKENARAISENLTSLQSQINLLRYQESDGAIDETYELATSNIRSALTSLDTASTYRGYYYSCRESWGTSHSRPTSGCEEGRTMSETYECGSEEEPATCVSYWREYRCTCKDYYKSKYSDKMSKANYALLGAKNEVESLEGSINNWFYDHSYDGILTKISKIHGHETFEGLTGFYYNHHSINPSQNHVKDFKSVLNLNDPQSEISPQTALSYTIGSPMEEEFLDYGYAFIHATFTSLNSGFNPKNADIQYDKARDILKAMQKDGFFEFLLELITAISDLLNQFGQILNLLSIIEEDRASFPMLKDHIYATFPVPPLDQNDKGFSLLHDIRIRADNHPGVLEFSLPIIGERRIELPPGNDPNGGTGYSIPIPFTPLHIYAWGFDITRSQVGSEPLSSKAVPEKSTLWLADYESQGYLAPFAMMRLDDNHVPAPVYLHKPLMFKYEFTAGDYLDSDSGISKGFNSNKLPPVIVIALGPFTTSFKGWIEPPDSSNHLPIDVALEDLGDHIVVTATLQNEVVPPGDFLFRVYETGKINNRATLLSRELTGSLNELPLKLDIKKSDLSQLETHGWSILNADLYALDNGDFPQNEELLEHVIGEDHANLVVVNPDLKIGVSISDYNSESIIIRNWGNRRVEVTLTAEGECCFFKDGRDWYRDLWSGDLEANEAKRVDIRPVGPNSLTLKAEIPVEVQRLIQNSSSMRLVDNQEIR